MLAGVSVDYYVRLEQGRDLTPSESVLDALARALRLDDTERAHLIALARPPRIPFATPDAGATTEVRPSVQMLMDGLDQPAFVMGRRMDILATNGWRAPC
jgi:transcriptional regulator with XRE-family HTH domain